MQKTKVVIASVLKPIDDTRMYEKFGLSMAKTSKYDVNIIGFASKNIKAHDSITFHPLGTFARMSWPRLFAPIRIFKLYLKVKPDIIIANTHEILLVTIIYRILFGAKTVYDIRENYVKNILYTNVFPRIVRPFLAAWVRFKEWTTRPFFNEFILAEQVYRQQLRFVPEKAVVVENKYKIPQGGSLTQRPLLPDTVDLIYSGTISGSNGVFEAIEITEQLHRIDSTIRLKIVGYCALKADLVKLHDIIKDKDFVELLGGDYLVPHATIVEEIANADFGFVLKKPNNGINDDKLLTRLFEYTSNHLPIIMLDNPTWISFCDNFNAAIPIDPNNYDSQALYKQMKSGSFYDKGDTAISNWATEEPRLLATIDSLKA
ncbi:MAG: glycosyltransferase family 4 protein [Roseivirga sp.]|nr:glycosyltransferase family 4 protein [Roseivirga sp.]